MPYPVALNLGAEGFTLVGAGICHIGGADVVCSRWEKDGQHYTLLQFRPGDYGLPPVLERHHLEPREPWQAHSIAHVEVWDVDGSGFALVAKRGDPAPLAS